MPNHPTTEHFTERDNLACPCCGKGGASVALLILLEVIRDHFKKPVHVDSCARCKKHNIDVGSTAKKSEHLITDDEPLVDAADIRVADTTPTQVRMFLNSLPYANLLGIGKYKTFTHVDTRGYGARW